MALESDVSRDSRTDIPVCPGGIPVCPGGNPVCPVDNALLPRALQWAGPLLAAAYGAGVKIHRAISSPHAAALPVICIGNLTVGGTGKTPAVKYFARTLAERGRKPAVLMRGYKNQANDEAREVEQALREHKIPVLIGADRLAGATRARQSGCDCVLLDDGFQHWRLARDLDIVLIDATNPFGGGHLLPRGRLREPVEGLARAGVVIVTRANHASPGAVQILSEKIRAIAPSALIASASHEVSAVYDCASGKPVDLAQHPVFGFCGIGNPDAFRETLSKNSRDVRGFRAFADHCGYDVATLDREVVRAAKAAGAAMLVTTEKDATKLKAIAPQLELPVCVVAVSFKLLDNADAALRRIAAAAHPALS